MNKIPIREGPEDPINVIEVRTTKLCYDKMIQFGRQKGGALKIDFVSVPPPNVHQAAYESRSIAWLPEEDHCLHLYNWILCFPPEAIQWFGEFVYYELKTIAEYVASFFAEQFQIVYELSTDSENYFIHFLINTVHLDSGFEQSEDFIRIWFDHFCFLLIFLANEYGMGIDIPEIIRRAPICYQKKNLLMQSKN